MVSVSDEQIPREYCGWWRIIERSQWGSGDIVATALISPTGYGGRLRMFALLAYVNCKPTNTGVSFTWQGAWEYDPVSSTGSVRRCKDGRLAGKIKNRAASTFVAERAADPEEPIPIRRAQTVGRNDPCPCGSGRRFKKCCGLVMPCGMPNKPLEPTAGMSWSFESRRSFTRRGLTPRR